jgi:hypothetical protein
VELAVVLLEVIFFCLLVTWLSSGAINGLGVQLSFRKAAMDGVVNRAVSAGSGIAAGLSNKTGLAGAAMTAGNSPPRATRAISTSIICLMRIQLSFRYP